jgi:Cu+-exporting ATPase
MDTLIAIGTTAAYVYSAIVTFIPGYFPFTAVYFETAAIIITLILIGRLLETKTKEKASDAVRKLLDLKPRTARLLRPEIREKNNANQGGMDIQDSNTSSDVSRLKLVSKEFKEVEIPVEEVLEGDLMIIRPGERVPTDGTIIDGSSSIDESAITGESIPVDKIKGDEVIGATINKNGLLKVRATKIGQDTVLSQIITLVEEDKTVKAKLEKMVDNVSKNYDHSIIIIAI